MCKFKTRRSYNLHTLNPSRRVGLNMSSIGSAQQFITISLAFHLSQPSNKAEYKQKSFFEVFLERDT